MDLGASNRSYQRPSLHVQRKSNSPCITSAPALVWETPCADVSLLACALALLLFAGPSNRRSFREPLAAVHFLRRVPPSALILLEVSGRYGHANRIQWGVVHVRQFWAKRSAFAPPQIRTWGGGGFAACFVARGVISDPAWSDGRSVIRWDAHSPDAVGRQVFGSFSSQVFTMERCLLTKHLLTLLLTRPFNGVLHVAGRTRARFLRSGLACCAHAAAPLLAN